MREEGTEGAAGYFSVIIGFGPSEVFGSILPRLFFLAAAGFLLESPTHGYGLHFPGPCGGLAPSSVLSGWGGKSCLPSGVCAPLCLECPSLLTTGQALGSGHGLFRLSHLGVSNLSPLGNLSSEYRAGIPGQRRWAPRRAGDGASCQRQLHRPPAVRLGLSRKRREMK